MALRPAELILNSDGSLYHLNLLPEDLAPTIITVGDPERVPLVSRYFDKIELQKGKREFITHTGYLGGRRLSVVSTGIGTDNIDIVINEIDALFNINLKDGTPQADRQALNFIRIGTSEPYSRISPWTRRSSVPMQLALMDSPIFMKIRP